MNKRFEFSHLLILFLAISLVSACNQEKEILYSASDFTAEGEFTAGIEGPATDQDGPTVYLFLVCVGSNF